MIEYLNFENANNQFLFEQMQGYNLTQALINQELTGVFNTQTLRDMQDILKMYNIYFEGSSFTKDKNNGQDYTPADWHAKKIKMLIDKEARFLFSEPPDITLVDTNSDTSDNDRIQPNQEVISKVLKENRFSSKLVRAAKDCLIGKRIALVMNFDTNSNKISVTFVPSLEFVYETDPANVDKITKFIQFYSIVVNEEKSQQRIYKKNGI